MNERDIGLYLNYRRKNNRKDSNYFLDCWIRSSTISTTVLPSDS